MKRPPPGEEVTDYLRCGCSIGWRAPEGWRFGRVYSCAKHTCKCGGSIVGYLVRIWRCRDCLRLYVAKEGLNGPIRRVRDEDLENLDDLTCF